MFKIGLSGFRVFESTQEVEIRPITLLTGGNSSGKTSFLAGLRMLADMSSQAGGASFNKDPFFLGSYDQIAHHRGGRFGRVKSFGLHLCGRPDPRRSYRYVGRSELEFPSDAHVSLTFKNRFGQAAIAKVCYTSQLSELTFEFSESWSDATVRAKIGGREYEAASEQGFGITPDQIAAQPSILPSIAESLLFRKWREATREVLVRDEGVMDVRAVAAHFEAAMAIVPPAGFVGAPVRTRPLRTYDPTESAPQSEGSHVPAHMAQLARTRPTEWSKTRAEIVNFGKTSGLFQDLELRTLGRGDSDPFQLNVVINGPKRNIVDVGYGVSQAIPIVFELARRVPRSLYIMQQPEVHLHPEAQAALGTYLASNISRTPGFIIMETHSDFLIDRIRRHVRDGTLKHSDVSILYFSRHEFHSDVQPVNLNERGEIEDPPAGYREFFLREQIANLGF